MKIAVIPHIINFYNGVQNGADSFFDLYVN